MKKMTGEFSAVIPVKMVSSRLPGKNTLPFGDSNLLTHKIRQLKETEGIAEIVVSSDSDKMLEMAAKEGCLALKRPAYLADESRPLQDFVKYIRGLLSSENMMWTCVTSPLFGVNHLRASIAAYRENVIGGTFDSLVAVTEFKHYLFDEKGPLNFGIGVDHKNSQELPDWRLFTNGTVMAPTESVFSWGSNFGPNPFQFFVAQEFSIDIDTRVDYEIAVGLNRLYGSLA